MCPSPDHGALHRGDLAPEGGPVWSMASVSQPPSTTDPRPTRSGRGLIHQAVFLSRTPADKGAELFRRAVQGWWLEQIIRPTRAVCDPRGGRCARGEGAGGTTFWRKIRRRVEGGGSWTLVTTPSPSGWRRIWRSSTSSRWGESPAYCTPIWMPLRADGHSFPGAPFLGKIDVLVGSTSSGRGWTCRSVCCVGHSWMRIKERASLRKTPAPVPDHRARAAGT